MVNFETPTQALDPNQVTNTETSLRSAAYARVEAAIADGRQSEIDAANAAFRELQGPVTPQVERLPATRARSPQEFTGAARRVALTGGRMRADGGAHRGQTLYR